MSVGIQGTKSGFHEYGRARGLNPANQHATSGNRQITLIICNISGMEEDSLLGHDRIGWECLGRLPWGLCNGMSSSDVLYSQTGGRKHENEFTSPSPDVQTPVPRLHRTELQVHAFVPRAVTAWILSLSSCELRVRFCSQCEDVQWMVLRSKEWL